MRLPWPAPIRRCSIIIADETKELLALLTPAELAALDAKPKTKVKEASPFSVTGGEVDPNATRPAAPKGFDGVKVK